MENQPPFDPQVGPQQPTQPQPIQPQAGQAFQSQVSQPQPMPIAPAPQAQMPEQPPQQFFVPQQPLPVQPEAPMQSFNTQPVPKKHKWLRRIGKVFLIFILVLALAVGVFYLKYVKTATVDNTSATIALQQDAKKGKLTAASVAKISKTNLFFGVMYNIARQPLQHLQSESGSMATPTSTALGDIEDNDGAFNYGTKQLYYSSTYKSSNVAGSDGLTGTQRCVGAQEYSWSVYDDPLLPDAWTKSDDSHDCDYLKGSASLAINDGINTGGLTSEQAYKFVQSVFAPRGLITVTSESLVIHDGKQYVRLTAKVTPVKAIDAENNVEYNGMQYFVWAFKDTGLDFAKQPYNTAGTLGSGMQITQYIDPQTALPAYAEYLTDPGVNDSGKAQTATEIDPYTLNRVQYTFGQPVPVGSIANPPAPLVLSWPAEKR